MSVATDCWPSAGLPTLCLGLGTTCSKILLHYSRTTSQRRARACNIRVDSLCSPQRHHTLLRLRRRHFRARAEAEAQTRELRKPRRNKKRTTKNCTQSEAAAGANANEKGRAGVSDTSAENCSASHKVKLNSRSKIQNAAREAGCIKQRPVMPCDLLVVLRDANAQEAAPHHDTTVQHSFNVVAVKPYA